MRLQLVVVVQVQMVEVVALVALRGVGH